MARSLAVDAQPATDAFAVLTAGAALSPVSASFSHGQSETRGGIAIHLGLRLTPAALPCRQRVNGWCGELRRFAVTPHLAYGATHLRGLDRIADGFAFSFLDIPGWRMSYRLMDRLRVSYMTRSGKHTAEVFENGDVSNYWTGSGRTTGFAIEVPLVPSGRGLEVAVLRSVGTFNTVETLNPARNDKIIGPASVPYRSVVLQVGWSGPFTGVSWPWQ